jgi:hypothetical protein
MCENLNLVLLVGASTIVNSALCLLKKELVLPSVRPVSK